MNRAAPRRGVSLMEVLISIFVLSMGLLGVAALIPVGGFALLETDKADRSGDCGRAGLREVEVRRMLDYQFWSPTAVIPSWWPAVEYPDLYPGQNPNPPPAIIPVMGPFAIDPLGVAKGLAGNFGGTASPIPRITLTYLVGKPAAADRIFRWRDDLVFAIPDDPEVRPQLLSDGEVAQFEGNYTWLLTVTPAAAEAALPAAGKTLYSVSVAVCYKRDFSLNETTSLPSGEHTAAVTFAGGIGYGGGSVTLTTPSPDDPPLKLRENEWIMLCGGGQCKWYRVVAADSGTPTSFLSLTGPDWDTSVPATAVVIDSVVGVYTTTVELDRSPLWGY